MVADFIRDFMAKKYPHFRLEIAAITVPPLRPGHVILRDVRFASSRDEEPAWRVRVEQLAVDLDLLPLVRREVRIGRVRIARPEIIYRHAGGHLPASPPRSKSRRPPNFEVRAATVENGAFRFVSEDLQAQVRDLNVSFAPLGPTKPEVQAEARGRLEDEGAIELAVRVPLTTPERSVDLRLRVREREFVLRRNSEEGAVSFILRALREALS
jgi:hypothetical protein